ncbi:Putative glycerol-3-phosphate transporter 1 [Linum grandiflorum]
MGQMPSPATETAAVSPLPNPKPIGIRFLEKLNGNKKLSYKTHQAIVLIVTFLAYAGYHSARKTTSIVKSALDPTKQSPNLGGGAGVKASFFQVTYVSQPSEQKPIVSLPWTLGSGWAPFNGADGTSLLGEVDLAFLAVYAIGMFFSGHLGDRMNLRLFLTVGMLGTGLFTALFGAGFWLDVHNFYYFLAMQMAAGLFQSTGWPSVVAVVGNWCGKKKRGLIMGVWNAHTSVGNISGSLIAAAMLRYGWGWSFVVPGLAIGVVGVVVFLFLGVSPSSVGASEGDEVEEEEEEGKFEKNGELREPLLLGDEVEEEKAVGFMEAWRIPGVAPFALCLFFAKLVAYTFLYWLPFYISHTAIDGKYISDGTAGNLSTLFDVGGVVGGILAGHISDRLNARAITAASFMYCAIPALYLYRSYGDVSLTLNIVLMLLTGMFVNGPYALITTAVSADLGTHSSLKGNSRALATVTAIIDGTGSVGAAIGPLLTGYISATSWSAVFTMLMAAAFVAGLLLTRLVVAEVAAKIAETRSQGNGGSASQVAELDV